jgi:sugar lactone lactonase YvrE
MLKSCLKIYAIIFILIGIVLPPAFAQLNAKPQGYRFEEQGFLSMPGVLAYDSGRHRLAIADKGRNLVYIFDLTDETYQTLGIDRELQSPIGLAFDSRGSLYLAQEKTPILLIYKFQSEIPDTLNLNSILPVEIKKPGKIYVDSDGIKYLIDNDKNDIYVIDSDNKYVRTISEKLKYPDGIAVSRSGELIIADKGFDPILIFKTDGEFERRFSRPESPTSQFSYNASGIAIDQRGWIYTLDITRNKVVIFDPTGVSKSEWIPDAVSFFPEDIAIDRYDNIYISERGSGSVKIYARGN